MAVVLLIDNYDSFTYNLARYFEELGAAVRVVKNDEIQMEEIPIARPSCLVLSPGPGRPERAGITMAAIRRYAGVYPILGVCLGHQAIGLAFGARVVRATRLMHGKTSAIHHAGEGIFRGLPNPFPAARYHSLLLDPSSIPPALRVTAWTAEGEVMGVAHRSLPVYGVQFHPESILSSCGHELLARFLATTTGKEGPR